MDSKGIWDFQLLIEFVFIVCKKRMIAAKECGELYGNTNANQEK